jgi:NADH-quinone oxidoreductase subunit M
MTTSFIPWIELAVLLPLGGAIWVRWLRDPDAARLHSLWISGITLVCTCAAWLSLPAVHTAAMAREQWDRIGPIVGSDLFVIDEFSAPLLPLGALLFLLMELATLRTKVKRFSFSSVLVRESILLATFAWRLARFRPGWNCGRERGPPECTCCTWACSSACSSRV